MKPMNLLTGALSLTNSRFAKAMDWLLAIASVIYGIYILTSNSYDGGFYPYVWIGFGLISFILAYKRPSEIIEAKVKSSFSKK